MKSSDMERQRQLLLVIIPLGILLVLVAFLIGAYWGIVQRDRSTTVVDDDVVTDVDDTDEDGEVGGEPDVVGNEGVLNVTWLPVESQTSIKPNATLVELYTLPGDPDIEGDEQPPYGAAFLLGSVNGGPYNGYDLTVHVMPEAGLGVTYMSFYILADPDDATVTPVVLDRYGSAVFDMFTTPVEERSTMQLLGEQRLSAIGTRLVFDTAAEIPEFFPADTVRDTQGREFSLYGVWNRVDFPTEFPADEYLTTTTLVDGTPLKIYIPGEDDPHVGEQLLFAVREDARVEFYDVTHAFWPSGETRAVPSVRWSDGTVNADTFIRGEQGGCGQLSPINVVKITDTDSLTVAGSYTAADGQSVSIYEPESWDSQRYVDAYGIWKMMTENESFEEFKSSHPFFYVEDSLGRWIEFTNTNVLPAAECGKPVIYLYPETTMDIDVQLAPRGGFSITEPLYGPTGWHVTASPDGTLVNREDGKTYPYLFWEGWGAQYVAPRNYWVVAREDVHAFLVTTLAKLGLNTQESADFMEFWEPRMQAVPYYKIGFHGTRVMDLIAPMTLSQKPQTILRILMDYSELSQAIPANPPTLPPTPVRKGFTVIEWGGVLR